MKVPINSNKGRGINRGAFVCKVPGCWIRVQTMGELDLHIRNGHARKEFQCSECAMSYETEGALASHQKSHSLSRKFVCDYCGSRFESEQNLLNHRRKEHVEPFKCRYHITISNSKGGKRCKFEALSQKELYDHIIADHPVKRFKCKLCPLSFNSSASRWKHTNREHVKKGDLKGESPVKMPALESAIMEHDEDSLTYTTLLPRAQDSTDAASSSTADPSEPGLYRFVFA
eukprot:sb/3469462/